MSRAFVKEIDDAPSPPSAWLGPLNDRLLLTQRVARMRMGADAFSRARMYAEHTARQVRIAS